MVQSKTTYIHNNGTVKDNIYTQQWCSQRHYIYTQQCCSQRQQMCAIVSTFEY